MTEIKILAFAGSTRKESFNKQLIKLAAETLEDNEVEITVVDLKEFPLPLYDGDDEAAHGLPEKAAELKKLMSEAHGFIISSPEYNGSLSAVLKNTIDWTTRPGAVEGSVYQGKPVFMLSASPGGLGGLRGLYHLRDVLSNIGALVVPAQYAVSKVHEVLGEEASRVELEKNLAPMVADFIDVVKKLSLTRQLV